MSTSSCYACEGPRKVPNAHLQILWRWATMADHGPGPYILALEVPRSASETLRAPEAHIAPKSKQKSDEPARTLETREAAQGYGVEPV